MISWMNYVTELIRQDVRVLPKSMRLLLALDGHFPISINLPPF